MAIKIYFYGHGNFAGALILFFIALQMFYLIDTYGVIRRKFAFVTYQLLL
jgi:hypothetical protein